MGEQEDMRFDWPIPAKIKQIDVVKKDLRVVVFISEAEAWTPIFTGAEAYITQRPVGINEAASLKERCASV